MYAVVEIAGKQYKVEEGRHIDVDRLDLDEGADLDLDQVLLVSDGKSPKIGAPTVSGASVKAKVMRTYKDKKVIVYKMKRKKGYRRKQGHRQQYTRLMIESIKG